MNRSGTSRGCSSGRTIAASDLDEIGNIEYALDAVDVYTRGYLLALDVDAIRWTKFKVVADYAHAPSADVLPQLLDKLQVESVPLNARVEASKASILQDEFRGGTAQLARITQVLDNVSLGVRLDVGGEKMFVADDQGISVPDPVMCAVMASLVFRTYPGSTVVVTVDQPLVYEHLAEQHGGHVRRCPADPQALMHAATEDGVAMAGDGTGCFVFPALHPAIDGLFALGKLLEMLARQQTRLSDVIAGLPPFHMATGSVRGRVGDERPHHALPDSTVCQATCGNDRRSKNLPERQ